MWIRIFVLGAVLALCGAGSVFTSVYLAPENNLFSGTAAIISTVGWVTMLWARRKVLNDDD